MPIDPAVLRSCPLFTGFTDTGLRILAQMSHDLRVAAGREVFSAGDEGHGMFIIEAGHVEVFALRDSKPVSLATLGPGDSFGEMALLRPGRRAVGTRATEDVRLVELRRTDFNTLLKDKPQACVKLMLAIFRRIEERLRELQDGLLAQL